VIVDRLLDGFVGFFGAWRIIFLGTDLVFPVSTQHCDYFNSSTIWFYRFGLYNAVVTSSLLHLHHEQSTTVRLTSVFHGDSYTCK